MQLGPAVERNSYPLLSGGFLIALAAALALASWAVGSEYYPYVPQRIIYRFSLATLDRVYLIALAIFVLHYAAYVAHYLLIGSRKSAVAKVPTLVFSPIKFVITWFVLIGLAGTYAVGASIASPTLFDTVIGPARDTAFLRVWNHTYFGFVLVASLGAAVIYLIVTSIRDGGTVAAFHWLIALLSLRSGNRFVGALNWILLLALASNFVTGFFILGHAPLMTFPWLPLHSYGHENQARLAHDIGTAFIVASFSGQIYLRLLPGNRWMLKTMFAGYEARN